MAKPADYCQIQPRKMRDEILVGTDLGCEPSPWGYRVSHTAGLAIHFHPRNWQLAVL